MSILAWIVLGLLAGLIAGMLTGGGFGILGDIAVGILGAIIGGFIFSALFGVGVTGFNATSLAIAVVGAIILIAISRAFRGYGRSV